MRAVGGLEAGRRIGEICLGGLGRVSLETTDPSSSWPFMVTVHTSQPVLACLGSQYAGWSLSVEDKGKKYHVLGSGPARALGSSEKLFDELGYRDDADSACLVLEADRAPPAALVEQVAKACKVSTEAPHLHLCADVEPRRHGADRRALPRGRAAQVARAAFPARTTSSTAWRPRRCRRPRPASSPPWAAPTTPSSMAGACSFTSPSRRKEAKGLADQLPSLKSKDYGKPFADIFAAVKGDFYAIDRMLFSPAKVTVTALESGESFEGGHIDTAILSRSFSYHARHGGASIVLFCERKKWHGRSISRAFQRARDQAAHRLARCLRLLHRDQDRARHPGARRPSAEGRASCCSCRAAASSRSRSISACCMPCASLASRCGTMRAPSSAASTNRPPPSFCNSAGIPTPWTWTGDERAEAALEIVQEKLAEGCKLVQKPLFGAQGKGLRLISAPDDLAPPEEVNGVYYLQEFIAPAQTACIGTGGIFVSAGRVVAVHDQARIELDHQYQARRPRQGGDPIQELADLALRAASCVGADYAGVDIIQDRSTARLSCSR